MGSRIRIKTLARRAALLSAGFLVQSNILFATEIAADAQMQARDLLSGTVNGRPRIVDKSPSPPSDGSRAPVVDAQEQARRLILGTPRLHGTTDETTAIAPTKKERTESPHGGVYADPQESARRMILGAGASGGATSIRQRVST
jgi:hypothetical protein